MKERPISILLCEDDINFGMLLSDFLQGKGYLVDLAQDGDDGWIRFCQSKYDVCIFDVMMPLKNGYELAKEIRRSGSDIPILFLSARTSKEDILEGYRVGGDDYVTKPCSMEILMYKIESITRRILKKEMDNKRYFQIGQFEYDSVRQYLTLGDQKQHLSSRENDLLLVLAQGANELVERNYILKTVWQKENYFNGRSLSVYINHLRKLLAGDKEVRIASVHGKGYKLVIPD